MKPRHRLALKLDILRSLCLSRHVVFRRDGETRDESTSSLLFFFSLSSACVWYEKAVATCILFYRKYSQHTYTQLYMLLSSVASEKGDVGRVGLMALVLGAPAPTRGRRSLEHRYSQLFRTSPRVREYRLASLELRDDSVLLFSPPQKDRICLMDRQMAEKQKGKETKKKYSPVNLRTLSKKSSSP